MSFENILPFSFSYIKVKKFSLTEVVYIYIYIYIVHVTNYLRMNWYYIIFCLFLFQCYYSLSLRPAHHKFLYFNLRNFVAHFVFFSLFFFCNFLFPSTLISPCSLFPCFFLSFFLLLLEKRYF